MASAQSGPQTAAKADHLFHSGSSAFEAGDLPKAHANFANLVLLVPQVAAAHTAFGAVLLAEGKSAQAVTELEKARSLDPHDDRAAINLGVAAHQVGQNQKAVDAFSAAFGRPGISLSQPEALAFAAALASTRDQGRAQMVIEDALTREPKNAVLQDALGTLLAQRGNYPAAEQALQQAILTAPDFAAAHTHLGSVLLAQSDPQSALTEFQTAERLGDTSPVLYLGLGKALTANGQNAEAVATLHKAVAASPASQPADLKYALALALENAGDSRTALPLFRDLVTEQPDNTGMLTNYGLALMQSGDAKAALEMYERAHAAGDATATLREDMGGAYLQQNDIEHAIEQFRAGLAVDPQNMQLHYDLGLAYKLKDDIPAALGELKYAAALDPGSPDPHYTLGVLEMQRGEFADARMQLEQTVALQPANGDAWSILGSVDKQNGDNAKAAEALRRAIELQPAQPSPHITLAAILAEQGDKEGAAAERKIAAGLSREAVTRQRAQFALESGRALLAKGQVNDAITQLETAVNATPDAPDARLALADALNRAGRTAEALQQRQKAADLAHAR